ncbi:MAG: SH3 domain-containing protein, partial [Anaerolineales bacterium]
VEVISAPTFTWTPQITLTSPSPSGDENLSGTPGGKDIFIGDYVEINGTQGDGLRLRSKPGLDGEILFVVYEGEIFKVDDGPQDASGYRWWHLIAPYDENVQGWAVDSYLKTVQQP